ncbi:hypothetical protein D2V17_09630 [Aurantiacibacter xanthus]|uniref:Uncharacterized protein n=1 Tax=Aurantiacibacter xanthus TaxID=1784712 RepID=A0A3A1P7W2_9SPHN|nr:hypothetical protein [Aurantiacibacter xanthus]RIV86343.1 hypothetical protein D2V17_09630 [Aurantiacibacter xanthus]|tara:strand:- start:35172 stop:35453 length:282 start_codon:yes stop_codon:yes gene_type:complete
MTQRKTLIIALIGFGAGFVLRPAIAPAPQTASIAASAKAGPRGKQYFAAHLDEARHVQAQCAEGTVRGDECFNAEMAAVEADGRARSKRFFGN